MKILKLISIQMLLLFFSENSFAQELVPNGGFEDITDCPDGFSQIDKATGWSAPQNHDGSPDLFTYCATSPEVLVPLNAKGAQYPRTGEVMAGIILYQNAGDESREYLEIELTEALMKDTVYVVSYYYSLAENSRWSTNSFGIHFSDQHVMGIPKNASLGVTPQLQNTEELDAMRAWIKHTYEYKANGNEKHVILGNFSDNANTVVNVHPDGQGTEQIYIFLDDFSVKKKECELEVDLGEDIFTCLDESIVLEPTTNGDQFRWSDGSDEPKLEVTEAGTYFVEIFNDHCTVRDEVVVQEVPHPDFSLGNDTTICLGDLFELFPKGSAEKYTWSDSSHERSYAITYPGVYWAEMDYECGTVRDTIVVDQYDCECKVYVPNAFTPNDDEINNDFSIVSTCDLDEYNLRIFNKHGDEIFESQELSDTWPADFSGQVPNDRYQYVLKYRFKDRKETSEVNGSVFVLR